MIRGRDLDAEFVGPMLTVLMVVTMLAAMLLVAAPRPFGPAPVPLLPVMTTYFWTMLRPSLLPAPAAFLYGLALDLLTGTPLGFWAVCLLAVSGSARALRPFVLGASLWRRAAGMAVTMAVVTLAAMLAFGAAGRPVPASWMQLFQALGTVLTYPVLESALFMLARGAGLSRGRS